MQHTKTCLSRGIPPNRTLPLKQYQYQGRLWEVHQCAKFRRNRSNRGDIAIFWFFKMAAAAILDFQILTVRTVRTVKRVELRNHAKFCRNRLNRGRDMAIFRFFKMAEAAILDFKYFKFVTVGTVKKLKLHQCAKFHRNGSNRGRDMWVSILC